MSRATARSLAFVASLALLASCASVPEIDGVPAPIVGGAVDNGDPNVYFLLIRGSGSCTAELISPHVILTARHCLVDETTDAMIPPRQLRVYVGRDYSSFVHSYTPMATRIIPDSTNVIGFGNSVDLGLIILATPAMETPLTISRQDYHMVDGMPFTAIGFGQIPSGSSGRKYRATGMVRSVGSGLIHVNNVICQGDSGGPFIGPDGNVWGVVSYGEGTMPGMQPDCGTSLGTYNSIFTHLDWIDSVLVEAGDLCIPHAEVCDGIDNDCNGMADEGCLMLGEACTDSARCTSGHCEATPAGMICTTACDATRPGIGCDDGYHCVHSDGCTGWCTPGAPGTLGVGATCTSDDVCESGNCVDPGDGVRRCLAACFGDSGQCASGEVCTAADQACGACVPSAIFGSARGLGEECTADDGCRSGHCLVRAGIGECVSPCTIATDCSPGFVCEADSCVLDRAQPPGGVCHDLQDCLGGICILSGDRGWCTPADCTSTMCPDHFTCTMVGTEHVCTPMVALDGESCGSDAGCASGLCYMGACSAVCSEANDCGSGLRCVRSADGTSGHCVLPSVPHQGGGCSVGATGTRGPLALVLLALLFGASRRMRRTRA